MAFIVEDGTGSNANANAYVDVAFVTTYLTDRNRQTENSWDSSTSAVQQASIIKATDYIDRKFFNRFKGKPRS